VASFSFVSLHCQYIQQKQAPKLRKLCVESQTNDVTELYEATKDITLNGGCNTILETSEKGGIKASKMK
jgi:hypothetical protein